jgi:hypothetical protein
MLRSAQIIFHTDALRPSFFIHIPISILGVLYKHYGGYGFRQRLPKGVDWKGKSNNIRKYICLDVANLRAMARGEKLKQPKRAVLDSYKSHDVVLQNELQQSPPSPRSQLT